MNKEAMRKNAVKLLKVALICSPMLLLPLIGPLFANNRENNCQQGPPPSVTKGCEGKEKEVDDSAGFAGHNGEKLKARCQKIQNQLIAVPNEN